MIQVNVFWTAGLDSTCRIVELASSEGYDIQPYYLLDEKRRSHGIELRRIASMTELIRSNPATRSRLRDILVVNLKEINIDPGIVESWKPAHTKYSLGRQYYWIASFLRERGLVAEISLEKGEYGATLAINSECSKRIEGLGNYRVYRVEPERSTKTGRDLFENLAMPLSIWNLTKQEEAAMIKDLGYEEVFELTWFCHKPIFGLPCGHCHPCQSVRKEGMGWRIPVWGRILYWPLNPFINLYYSLKRRLH